MTNEPTAEMKTPRGRLAETVGCAPFSQQQLERGRELYTARCSECHGGSLRGGSHGAALTGRAFSMRWRNRAASLLHQEIRTTMPPGEEDTLGPRATSDILAFMLSESGGTPGDEALPTQVSDLHVRRLCVDSQ